MSHTQFTKIELQNGVYVSLANYGVIRATGADAKSFLHAQLTQDVQNLSDAETKLAGYCSAKGRLYAIFQMYIQGEDVYLITHRSVLEIVIKRLRMFVLRAKVVLDDVSDSLPIIGFCAPSALSAGTKLVDGDVVRLGLLPAVIDGVRYARELRVGVAGVVNDALAADVNAWEWLEIMAGVPHVQAANSEAFVPQMVNLDRIGGVNFKKGCYPGQEIVARSHYLGKLKRRMQSAVLEWTDDQPQLTIGTDVYSSQDATQPAGQIVAVAANPISPNTSHVLYEVSLPMVEGDATLSAQGVHAIWQKAALPYALSDA
ncbi:folate-binding protein [Formosimonas limnophila]|uniref:Folate-binding protein n=1 Tax=Formosimonas limnophila TaxID=1384487 RepID=A0A8J3FXW3_9BURK|nr:folate-binding protein YgfZ [Formosimonas limnophila]GHA68089.1 folate-binding protein [Formosimonas limnophila]